MNSSFKLACLLIALFGAFSGCKTEVKSTDSCGDGFLDPGEECDGAIVPVQSCEELGYYATNGALRCNSDCTLDRSVCAGSCGDDLIQAIHGEECEGENLNGKNCLSIGLGAGELSCNSFCTFDVSGCELQASCGDGTITSPREECEGTNLGDQTCVSLGYYGGVLSCTSNCIFDRDSCISFGRCGDSQLQKLYGEECEGSLLDGETCQSRGWHGGTLLCGADCRFDESGCAAVGRCGDDQVQAAFEEVCDGADLAGQTCQSLGWYGGELACDGVCGGFDESGCAAVGRCGDDLLQSSFGEVCDGVALAGETCQSRGYHGGALGCNSDCGGFDESDCALVGRCGDGTIQGTFGEQCDGAVLGGASCQTLGFYTGTLTCGDDCRLDTSGCAQNCGDGLIQGAFGEQCEGANLGGATCATLGFHPGSLACGADCRLDTTGCAGRCGDGVIQGMYEACDGTEYGGRTCENSGYYGGALGCASDCSSLVFTDCVATGRCGDSTVQTIFGEQCDGANLDGASCLTRGFYQGALSCSAECRFDTSNCSQSCGDGQFQPAYEDCEDSELNGQECESLGYYGGILSCGADCRFDLLSCEAAGWCGDEIFQGYHEECDTSDFDGRTCRSYGFFTGNLGCSSTCQIQTSSCRSVVAVASRHRHTCALLSDGTVKCWGENNYGQLGDGSSTQRNSPVTVSGLSGVVQVSTGVTHTCAVLTEGTVKCWGQGNNGRLGDGTLNNRITPTLVTGIDNALQVSAGELHTCARLTGGTVKCWGAYNTSTYFGQMGDGGTNGSLTPVTVSGITTGLFLFVGNAHSCVVLQDGTVKCWGRNQLGQLGDGSNTDRSTPVSVGSLSGVVRGAANFAHTCVVRGAGQVSCWGFNSNGQLGNNTTSNTTAPVSVSGISNGQTLWLGAYHSCVVGVDQILRCWGANNNYQLGDGTSSDRWTPVPASLTGVMNLTAGGTHTCGLKSGGNAVWCVGQNDVGQLGDGTIINRTSFVQVNP